MEKDALAEWLIRHPAAVGLAFALVAAVSAYDAYRAGLAFGQLRAELADHARAASEALGG